jgi:hypothetical protein
VVVPGFNYHPSRATVLRDSLANINASLVDFKCIVFNYEEPIDRSTKTMPSAAEREILSSTCEIINYYYANYASYLKAVPPLLLEMAGFTHVFVLLDDVELKPSFKLNETLDIMTRNRLFVASPAIDGTLMWATKVHDYGHKDYAVGHRVHIIEIFATIFTLDGWRCWHDFLDPVVNSAGWGYEKGIFRYCQKYYYPDFDMGVLDSMVAKHHKNFGKISRQFVPEGETKMKPRQQLEYWRELSHSRRNVTIQYSWANYFGPRLE